MEFITNSPIETEAVGQALGKVLQPGSILAYEGDLGAGKTPGESGFSGAQVAAVGDHRAGGDQAAQRRTDLLRLFRRMGNKFHNCINLFPIYFITPHGEL